MKSMSYVSSAASFSWSSRFILKNSLYSPPNTSWTRKIGHAGTELCKLDSVLMKFHARCYSVKNTPATLLPKVGQGPSVKKESDAFYVVRKGDVVGVYRALKDFQSQVCDPFVSVCKGYCMCKEAEEYLVSYGLKNATYSISSADLTNDLFGTLEPYTDQQPDEIFSSSDKSSGKALKQKTPKEVVELDSNRQPDGPVSSLDKASRKTSKQNKPKEVIEDSTAKVGGLLSSLGKASGKTSIQKRPKDVVGLDSDTQPKGLVTSLGKTSGKALERKQPKKLIKLNSSTVSCLLEFDGASKGNPGKGGAGAILRFKDGSVVCQLREGLGIVTNNVAEYRAIILGMKCALKKGFKQILVQGDSKLVCMQILNLWQTKSQNIADLSMEAKELKKKFISFKIKHVERKFNSEADALANLAIGLESGEVQGE